MARLHYELTASSRPAYTLSTDSERYHTPYSSPSKNGGEHRGLVEVGATDSDILLRLQNDSEGKDDTIKSLEGEVNQLKKRLKYAEQLEESLIRSYAHEQKLQELAQRYEKQYHEELEENSQLQEKISQLEKEVQGQKEGNTHIDDLDDPDLNAELRRKDQHVHTLQAQVEALQQHSKGQSKQILQLKQELGALLSAWNIIAKNH